MADSFFHPHYGFVLTRKSQKCCNIHALDVPIPPCGNGLPVSLRLGESCLILLTIHRLMSNFLRKEQVDGRYCFIGHLGNNARSLNRISYVMNEENENANANHCQYHSEKNGQAWNKSAHIAAANGAQYDQAIGKNAAEDSQYDLCNAVTHEVSQDT